MNWPELQNVLTSLTEREVLDLLEDERRNARRSTFIIRLHQRFTTLRMLRERAELMREIDDTARTSETGRGRNRRARR